ncbi:MAG: polyphosphate polymerase domain-containing protein [Chitinophagaceae bacterium]
MNPVYHQHFSTLTLDTLKQKGFLKDRLDYKYTLSADLLPQIFQACLPHYDLLQIGHPTVFTYYTWYFDTRDRLSFVHHHQGKSNRYKLRFRHYLESEMSYLEFKLKNNKGRTHKERIKVEGDPAQFRLADYKAVLWSQFGLNTDDFSLSLMVRYFRSTLLHKTLPEKVTLDWGLHFEHEGAAKDFERIAIAEVKTPQASSPAFQQIMRSFRIREGGLSKYCLGIIALYPNVKHNQFKADYKKIIQLPQTPVHAVVS